MKAKVKAPLWAVKLDHILIDGRDFQRNEMTYRFSESLCIWAPLCLCS